MSTVNRNKPLSAMNDELDNENGPLKALEGSCVPPDDVQAPMVPVRPLRNRQQNYQRGSIQVPPVQAPAAPRVHPLDFENNLNPDQIGRVPFRALVERPRLDLIEREAAARYARLGPQFALPAQGPLTLENLPQAAQERIARTSNAKIIPVPVQDVGSDLEIDMEVRPDGGEDGMEDGEEVVEVGDVEPFLDRIYDELVGNVVPIEETAPQRLPAGEAVDGSPNDSLEDMEEDDGEDLQKAPANPDYAVEGIMGEDVPAAENYDLNGLPAEDLAEKPQGNNIQKKTSRKRSRSRIGPSNDASSEEKKRNVAGRSSSRQYRNRRSLSSSRLRSGQSPSASESNVEVIDNLLPRLRPRKIVPRNPSPPPRQNRQEPPPPVKNQREQDEFAKFPVLELNPNHSTPHPTRNCNGKCVFCQKGTSPHDSKYAEILKKFKIKKIQCGHKDGDSEQCNSHFHVACILESRPMALFDPQYLALPCNFNKLVCTDHVCQICHTDRKMKTARQGELLKVNSQCRSFHAACRPVGSILLEDGTLQLYNYTKREPFEGVHCPSCSVCGEEEKENNALVQCKNCIHSFHENCNNWNGDLCRRCTLDEQIEYGKPVLVELRGLFKVGTCVPWEDVKTERTINKKVEFGKEGYVAVRMGRDGKLLIKRLRELQRVPSVTAHATYKTILPTYRRMNREIRGDEEEVLKRILQARYEEYAPYTQPDLKTDLIYHQSLYQEVYSDDVDLISGNGTVPQVRTDIGIEFFGRKGRGVVALRDIPANTKLVEYIGELISKQEMAKRKALLDRSKDLQAPYYIYETTMTVEKDDEEPGDYDVGIDAAVHHNLAGFFNSSCAPNCITTRDQVPTDDVYIHRLTIETKEPIKKGTELTINYKWKGVECLCGTASCQTPASSIVW